MTLAQVTGLPLDSVASVLGRQTSLPSLVVPLVLVRLVDGRRGLREPWVPALVCGVAFAVAQFAASNHVSAQLADIGAFLAGAGALVSVTHARVPAIESVRAPGRLLPDPAPVLPGFSPGSDLRLRLGVHSESARRTANRYG